MGLKHCALALAAALTLAGCTALSGAQSGHPTPTNRADSLYAVQATAVPTSIPGSPHIRSVANRLSPAVVQITNQQQQVNTGQFQQPVPETAGIGFATSINTARSIAAQLVATGHAVHPHLGIQYVPLSPALAAQLNAPVQRGAYITGVDANSPAAKAGLQQGDVILSINGQDLQNESDLARIINGLQPGNVVTMTLQRDGQRLTLGQQQPTPGS